MATYVHLIKNDTIKAHETLYYAQLSWPKDHGSGHGPNRGPVIIAADPKANAAGVVKLSISAVRKCRRAPSVPEGPEVFYEYDITNEGDTDAVYDTEIVWGEKSDGNPW